MREWYDGNDLRSSSRCAAHRQPSIDETHPLAHGEESHPRTSCLGALDVEAAPVIHDLEHGRRTIAPETHVDVSSFGMSRGIPQRLLCHTIQAAASMPNRRVKVRGDDRIERFCACVCRASHSSASSRDRQYARVRGCARATHLFQRLGREARATRDACIELGRCLMCGRAEAAASRR